MEDTEEDKIEDEEKKESEGKEAPAADPAKRSKPASTPVIDNANLAAERMENANEKREELITREEALEANKRLDGDAEAGAKKEEETEDEKWEKDAKKRYEGTGMDPTPVKKEDETH